MSNAGTKIIGIQIDIQTPMPKEIQLHELSQLFLSATAQDCKEYREAVRDVIQGSIEKGKIFLQEDWALGGQFVVDVCETKVKQCDGYFGLFGYRYGWVPQGHTQSITELEFGWAVEHWGRERVPPIFILLPVKGSESDRYLSRTAQECLDVECMHDETLKTRSLAGQQEFLKKVKDWAPDRVLDFYHNRDQLRDKAQSCIQNWNLKLYRMALADSHGRAGNIPDADLGTIGRKDHFDRTEKAIEAFKDRTPERMIAFLVHGPENHGQLQFFAAISRWDEWDGMQVFHGQPSELDSIDSLIRWCCSQMQEPLIGSPEISALAKLIATRLERTSVVFILRTLGINPDRLAIFHEQFWQPLFQALSAYPRNGKGRMYWFLIDHEPLPDPACPGILREIADVDTVDYRQLLALPVLGPIKARHIQIWLKDLTKDGVIELDEDRRKQTAERATDPDGFPPNIYDRLNREGFWTA